MEVRNQEQAVVQNEVRARYRQQHAGHPTYGEGHDKADSPHHRRVEDDATLIHGEQPVEDLNPGRDGDNHGGNTEEGVDVRAGTHGEEVVQPNDERQNGNTDGCPYQRGVTEQTLTREGRGDFGEDPEHRQNQDVHFRVTPGPNQVDVHHHVATHIVGKEMGAQVTIQGQQRDGDGQNWERGDNQDVSAQRCPGEYWHLEHGHARGAHLDNGHEEVNTGQGSTDTGELQRPNPVINPYARTVLNSRQRRIGQPTGLRELTNAQRQVNQNHAHNGEPEAQVVEEREGYVARAELKRNHQVHQTDNKRHRHEEDHDDAVGGKDLIVVMRRQEAGFPGRSQHLLATHHDGVSKATQQHDDCHDNVHDTETFVVDRSQPLVP